MMTYKSMLNWGPDLVVGSGSLTDLVLRELWLSPSSYKGQEVGTSQHLGDDNTSIEVCAKPQLAT